MDEKETNSLTQPHADRKFTAVRLDMRRIIPRHSVGSRCQVVVMSDRMTALDVKKMAADKNGIEEDVVSRWHLVASVERGGERLKFILPDDYFPLSICTNSADSNVRFSLKWSKGTGGLSHRGADDISKSSTSDGRRSNEDQHHVGTCKPEEEMDRRFEMAT